MYICKGGICQGRQERTFWVEGTACTVACIREKVSTFENQKAIVTRWRAVENEVGEMDRARFFMTLHLSGVFIFFSCTL